MAQDLAFTFTGPLIRSPEWKLSASRVASSTSPLARIVVVMSFLVLKSSIQSMPTGAPPNATVPLACSLFVGDVEIDRAVADLGVRAERDGELLRRDLGGYADVVGIYVPKHGNAHGKIRDRRALGARGVDMKARGILQRLLIEKRENIRHRAGDARVDRSGRAMHMKLRNFDRCRC